MPSNEFTKCRAALSEADFQAVEQRFGIRIPADLRAHYLACNGGTPERPCWVPEGDDPICLKHFIPIRPTALPDDAFGKANTLQDTLTAVRDEPHLPLELLPFAEDWGGNYFCIDQATGAIYWYAMDLGDDDPTARQFLTGSLAEFVSGLVENEEE